MSLQMNVRLRDWARLPGWFLRQWRREFRDVRLILEENGDLRYFVVPASLQRTAMRGVVLLSAGGVVTITVLGFVSFGLHLEKAQLERSHKQIHAALLIGTDDLHNDHPGVELNRHDMLGLAESIRERDLSIRAMVSDATGLLTDDNEDMATRLYASGLTERAIKVIQSSSSVGGPHPESQELLDPLLRGRFLDVSARNRDLKDILFALPYQVPVPGHRITSRYGLRNHPISRRPQLHAGVDLVPTDGDDRVFSALQGRVILARNYNNYGNTVIVKHERGIESLYAHLDTINVVEGQEVDVSTVLGMVGNTGASTGKHLHFEISVGGYPVDPLKVIATAQYVQQAKNEAR